MASEPQDPVQYSPVRVLVLKANGRHYGCIVQLIKQIFWLNDKLFSKANKKRENKSTGMQKLKLEIYAMLVMCLLLFSVSGGGASFHITWLRDTEIDMQIGRTATTLTRLTLQVFSNRS